MMSKREAQKFIFVLVYSEYIWVSHVHIMGLKECFIFWIYYYIMMFIIIKFALCQNVGEINTFG